MKKLLLAFSLFTFAYTCRAQFSEFKNGDSTTGYTFGSHENPLKIGGRIAAYYEGRALKPGYDNYRHNSFVLQDAEIDLRGKTDNAFAYEVQVSIADLVYASSVGNTPNLAKQNSTNNTPEPTASGLRAAYIAYEGHVIPVHVKLGYDKLPYSQGSLNDVYNTPMWNHAKLYGGDFFSRRDMGLTLYRDLWRKRVNIYAGVYSGIGENVFEYGNDASGKPEYVGRIDFSFPMHMKFVAVDEAHSAPMFRIGVNARYADKTQPNGHKISTDVPDVPGLYGTRLVNGKKYVYGGDLIFMYKGFSFLFEVDMINMHPADSTDPLFAGTSQAFNGGVVNAGGYCTGVNYNFQKIHSVLSVNYEEFNGNDLIDGYEQWLYVGYAYTIRGFNSVLKAEYYYPVREDANSNPLKYTSQFHIGYQIVF